VRDFKYKLKRKGMTRFLSIQSFDSTGFKIVTILIFNIIYNNEPPNLLLMKLMCLADAKESLIFSEITE